MTADFLVLAFPFNGFEVWFLWCLLSTSRKRTFPKETDVSETFFLSQHIFLSPLLCLCVATTMSDFPPYAQAILSQLSTQNQQVAALSTQLQQLQSRLAALEVGGAPVVHPETLSEEALRGLEADPALPDHLKTFVRLLQISLPHLLSDEHLQIAQQAYGEIRAALTPLPPDADVGPSSGSQPGSRSRTPSRRFVQRNGRTFYIANSGRQYDTSAPPPYPCNRCGCAHWSWTPCQNPAHPAQFFYRNSPAGGPRPAPAPLP